MKIEEGVKLDYCDVLIRPKRSKVPSRSEIILERTYKMVDTESFWTGVPIIAANMYSTGTFAMAKSLGKHRMVTALHKHYSEEELIDFFSDRESFNIQSRHVFYTVGVKDKDIEKLNNVRAGVMDKIGWDEFPHMINVDVANGYSKYFNDKVKKIRELFPYCVLMAGNVVSREMTEQLILSGVNIVKVGIGPGSVCETRIKTGVGMPQLSAVAECADAAHGLNGFVCADGGCTCTGDVAKAIGAGADFVMLGGMFAGTDECEGEWKWQDESGNVYDSKFLSTVELDDGREFSMLRPGVKKVLEFYGMSSEEAQNNHNGGMKDYCASEGKCVAVSYKGPVDKVVQDILGGLRSSCSYVGAEKLKDFSKCCTFIRINNGRTHNTIFGE